MEGKFIKQWAEIEAIHWLIEGAQNPSMERLKKLLIDELKCWKEFEDSVIKFSKK